MDFEIENGVLVKYHGLDAHVVIPENVEKIGKRAFEDCTCMKSVTIPENVRYILDRAFRNCKGLTEITIPDTARYVEMFVFSGCDNLHRILYHGVEIPSGIISRVLFSQVGGTSTSIDEIFFFIDKKNFDTRWLSPDMKHEIIWKMFVRECEDKKTADYVRTYISDFYDWIFNDNYPQGIRKILNWGDYITKNNIDDFIIRANQKHAYQIQVILMEYKHSAYPYESQEEIIRRKFEL